MSFQRPGREDEPPREIELLVPTDVGAVREDVLGHDGPEPRRGARAAWAGLAVLAVVASLVVSVVLPHQRAAEHRRTLASYDRLLNLSAAGEASVELGVSQTRDIVQYAEPLLNSSLTTPQTRAELFLQVRKAAQQSSAAIDLERQRLAADPAARAARLKAARQATLDYLSDWSALFASAAGSGSTGPTTGLLVRQRAARLALVAAAPDQLRAVKAGMVLGVAGSS